MQRKRQMWPEKLPSSLDQSSVKAETKWKPVLKSEQFLISWTEVIRLSISALWCYLVKVHTDFRETCSPIQNTSVTGKLHIHQEDAKPHSSAWPPPRRIQLLRWPAYNPDLSPNESIWLMRQKLQQRCCRTAEQLELSIRQQRDKTSLLVLLPSNSKMNFVFSNLIKFNFATFENHCIQFFFKREFQLCWNWCWTEKNIPIHFTGLIFTV